MNNVVKYGNEYEWKAKNNHERKLTREKTRNVISADFCFKAHKKVLCTYIVCIQLIQVAHTN